MLADFDGQLLISPTLGQRKDQNISHYSHNFVNLAKGGFDFLWQNILSDLQFTDGRLFFVLIACSKSAML